MFGKLRGIFGGRDENNPAISDYSLLQVDIHSHLIPGIDDGAKTSEDSLMLLREMAALGFKKVITTPHVMADGYTNSSETIINGRDLLRRLASDNNVAIEIDASAEYNIDDSLYEKIEKNDLLPFGKNYILVEMPFLAKPSIMGDIIYKLQIAGYNVILAHPERYGYFHENNFESYESLKDRNVLFQVNIGSLTGIYGKGPKITADRMIDREMVNFMGTDLHGEKHLQLLKDALTSKHLDIILNYPKLLNKTLL